MIESGANVDAVDDENGWTPLHLASMKGHVEVAELLIRKGAIVNDVSDWGGAPLHWASGGGYVEVATLLVDNGANVNAINSHGWTPLHKASIKGHVEVARMLIDNRADVDAVDKAGWTPLHVAFHNGQIEVVKVLIESGANVNAATERGYTLLPDAARNGNVEVVKLLISNGANVHAIDNSGWMPLHHALGYASTYGRVEVARMLIEGGADVCADDDRGYTPVHRLCAGRNTRNSATNPDEIGASILKALLESSVDPLNMKTAATEGDQFPDSTPLGIVMKKYGKFSSGIISQVMRILLAFDSVGNCEPGVEVEENVILAVLETFHDLKWPKGVLILLQKYPHVVSRVGMSAMPIILFFIGRYGLLSLMYTLMRDNLIFKLHPLDDPTSGEVQELEAQGARRK